jgi:hypothetical protein
LGQVDTFLVVMQRFGDASGQRLNPSKTHILPLGAVPPDLPSSVGGLPVVSAATSLGMQLVAGAAAPAVAWGQLLEGVSKAYTRLAGMGHSTMGRGIASSSYGISKLLYHAEFGGLPPEGDLATLHALTAKLVDRCQAPANPQPKFAGIRSSLLWGNPKVGGFGVLPLDCHVRARHAAWALRLALGDGQAPWQAVAAALLRAAHPHLSPFSLLGWRPNRLEAAALPPALRRLIDGLRSLPPLAAVGEPSFQPGPWCASLPLWGNPLLPGSLPGEGLQVEFADVAGTPINSIPALLAAQQQVQCPNSSYTARLRQQLFGSNAGAFLDQYRTQQQLGDLLQCLPAAWVAAAAAAPLPPPGALAPQLQPPLADALALALASLGWRTPNGPIFINAYTVRDGTQLLLAGTPLPAERAERFAVFCRAALGPMASPASVQQSVDRLPILFTRLWQLRWDNRVKEVFWRLVYDGLPTAARQHRPFSCACASFTPCRLHHFWDCPVAQAVLASVSARLPGAPVLPRPAVWLCVPPTGQHEEAWAVVCLCALAAMERGRREMYRRLCEGQTPSPTLSTALQRHAVARFWELLTDFCVLGAAPFAWRASLPAAHPFFHFDAATSTWSVRR